jgi:hypothetical protein
MLTCRSVFSVLAAVGLLAGSWSNPIVSAEKDAKPEGAKVAGILVDRKDNWISVKADGEDKPAKYLIVDDSDKHLAEVLKTLFTVSRVELTYRAEGDSRQLVSIKRHVSKAAGKVTGEVVTNYGWWIEVRPERGVPDGYACHFPFDKNREMMEKIKELQAGDRVTLSFTTDFERHRIESLHKHATPSHAGSTPHKPGTASAAEHGTAKNGGRAAGILIDKKDGWITVKVDGEDEPFRYVLGDDPGRKLAEALKSIFGACRVQLIYQQDGDTRQLLGIKRQILKAQGTVTGDVVKVYNDFWVEVKPKSGVADAYAPGANYNDKEFMARLKGLQPGESVTITFTTDFERHRITTLRVNGVSPTKKAISSPH